MKESRLIYLNRAPRAASGGAESQDENVPAWKAIFAEASRLRKALAQKQATDEPIFGTEEIDDEEIELKPVLKGDTTILISETGKGSKHNRAGFRGLVWKNDMIRILDNKITRIDGRECIYAKVRHNMNKFKDPQNPEYRVYTGYIERSAFVAKTNRPQGQPVPVERVEYDPQGPQKKELADLAEKAEKSPNSQQNGKITLYGQEIEVALKSDETSIDYQYRSGDKAIRGTSVINEDKQHQRQLFTILNKFAREVDLAQVNEIRARNRVTISPEAVEFSEDAVAQAISKLKDAQGRNHNAYLEQAITFEGKAGKLTINRKETKKGIEFMAIIKFEGDRKIYRTNKYTVDIDAPIVALPQIAVNIHEALQRAMQE